MGPKAFLIFVCLAALAPAASLAADCSSYRARLEMAQGQEYYRRAQFVDAMKHFKAAVDLEDNCLAAKFALAGAYASEVVPGVDTSENQAYAEEAIALFRKILERDPHNINVLRDIGGLYGFIHREDRARVYFKKAVAAAPDDPDLYYLLAVTDWSAAFRDTWNRKMKIGLGMYDEFKNSQSSRQLCKDLQAANQELVDEGLSMLAKAMEKRPDYGDAMAYTSLLYQLKAYMECDKQARGDELRLSQKWMAQRKSARQQSMAQKDQGLAVDGFETGTLWFTHMLPPPPPPPEKKGQR